MEPLKMEPKVLQLHQEVIEETLVADAEKANKELTEAYKLVSTKAMSLMKTPSPAMDALEDAQSHTLKAMKWLVNPDAPAHHKALAHAASANMLLFRAIGALDPENTKETIDDAFVHASKSLKQLTAASEALD